MKWRLSFSIDLPSIKFPIPQIRMFSCARIDCTVFFFKMPLYTVYKLLHAKFKFYACVSIKIGFVVKCLLLLIGDALPPVDPSCMRLYSMRFCPYVHRTKLVLEHKKIL